MNIRGTILRAGAVVLAMSLAIAGLFALGSPAQAAGSASLSVSISPVDTSNAPKTTAVGGDTVGYLVRYSCLSADCENVTVQFPSTQTDPYGFGKQLLNFSSWTAPFAGATLTPAAPGTGAFTASLGTVTAGTSASFTVYYAIYATGASTLDTAGEFFPDGFGIVNGVTMSSTTAVGPVSATAPAVTWHNSVPTPAASMTQSASSVSPSQQVTYTLYMSSGVWVYGGSGRIVGSADYVGAGSYVAVDQLPAEAVFVSASSGGVYDAATHTVTWTNGTPAAPSVTAAGGWGKASAGGWTSRGPYAPRTVVVTYPASAFPDADVNGCNFTASVTNSFSTTLTYLDSAQTQKSTGTSSATTAVSCYSPFGRSTTVKGGTSDATSGNTRYVNVPPDVTGLTCPGTGSDAWGRACTPGAALAPFPANNKYWQVTTRNAGNVPGVAVIEDDGLDQADAPVYQISTSLAATIDYRYQCGSDAPVFATATGTSVALTPAQQAGGCRIISATATSGSLAAGNVRPADNGAGTAFTATFVYAVTTTAPIGQTRTNTAIGTMTYPGYAITDIANTSSVTIQFRAQPLVTTPTAKPSLTATFGSTAAVSGGGNAVPGRDVTFSVRGQSANIPDTITPEYIFIAPAGWAIDPDSAAFAPGSVPNGVAFSYRTVTVGGVSRQAVVASWPDGTVFGVNATWPTMTVVAQPTFAVAPGTSSVATEWIGDAQDQWDNTTATFSGAVQDTTDVDANGSTTDWFSSATQSVAVFSSSSLSVVKEICQADPVSGDCTWISDPGTLVPVAPNATDIRYRVTLQNTGNTAITNAVAYDVLPYVGDTGLTSGTDSTPRGSTFDETLNAVSDVDSALSLAYSASTDPARPEVDPGAGTPDDWGAGASGKRAIRATVASLAPGATVSFGYTTNVAPGSAIDSKACNSIAVASDQTLASEPLPVCATTAEADLSVDLSAGVVLQAGRPGTLLYTVGNAGASATAPALATLVIPPGITVTSFHPDGWSCASPDAAAAPAAGPLTLECTPVEPDGSSPRAIADGSSEQLDLPVTVTKAIGSVTVGGSVTGSYFDPDTDNNDVSRTFVLAADATTIPITKSDGVAAVTAGGQITYALTVRNPLLTEQLAGAVITDALPSGESFVSASDGGTESGGVVTWHLAPLAAGASANVTLTVRISPSVRADLTNSATVSAADPDDPASTLTGTDSDTDEVRALAIGKTSDVPAIGVSIGDVITYTVTEQSIGTAGFTATDPASIVDDLSGVLTEADFVAGSAELAIDGGAATSIADPAGSTLSWSGALPVGSTAVLRYRVEIVSGVTAVANAAYVTTPTSCAAGADDNGLPCAIVTDAFAPHLVIHKTAQLDDTNGNGTADAGESIAYAFVVENDGGTDATDVTVDDAKVTGITPASVSLAAGASTTFTSDAYLVTQADVDAGAPIVNAATANGRDTAGDALPESPDSLASVSVTAAAPALQLTKAADLVDGNGNGTADVGEVIDYDFTVVNTGNVTETAVAISDPMLSGVAPASADLAPGATELFTASYTVTQADVDAGAPISNTATATGTAPSGATTTSPPSTADVDVTLASSLSIVKTQHLVDANGNGTADAGESIVYGFTVTNTGNTPETDVAVDDPMLSGIAPASVSLAAKASQIFTTDAYTVTQADVDAGTDIANTATATGLDPDDAPVTSDPSSVTTPITPADPAITIVKSADLDDANGNGQVDVGETIRYGFVVTNSGNVTLTDVAVDDALVTGLAPAPATLAPGAQQVFTADPWTATQADIDQGGTVSNTATATAFDPALLPVASLPSTVVTPLADPDPRLSIVKTATLRDSDGDGLADAGESIGYSFVVTNVGNVTLHDVAVDDPKVTGITPATATLIPGQQEIVTSDDYRVVPADLVAGQVVNSATASGEDPHDGSLRSEPSTVRTETASLPVDPARAAVLAFTGANPTGAMLVAGALLVVGFLLALLERRRRRS